MKKSILSILLMALSLSVSAVPVRKGTTKTFHLADGTAIELTLCGDEYGHWWQSTDGQRFSINDDATATLMTAEKFETIKENSIAKRNASNNVREQRMAKARRAWGNTTFTGQKKGLVILVNFSDKQMKATSTQEEFNNMFNEEGYSNFNHIGSVRDYFKDQSYGQFELDFDVVGPVTVSKNMAYYGKNDSDGNDKYAGTMVAEACKLVDDSLDINFADYDWDGDGEVDQVYLIYAGYGENAGASANTIWPHEYELSSAGYYGDGAITLDGVTIDTYAVSCELSGTSGSSLNGIGTACHEFSHCLGYPDFYDIDYSGGWGMAGWDVMDTGSYSGPTCNGEVPTGYTSYERMYAGWLEPKELNIGDTIDSLKPLIEEPDVYILYNDNNNNEYYLLENRTSKSWFKYVEDFTGISGLLIIHVDYNKSAWDQNTPNDTKSHQRMTIIPASNKFPTYTSKTEYQNQLYPTSTNTELTNTSTPSASLFNKNTDGKKLMNKPIYDIAKSSDGIISFKCGDADVDPVVPDTTQTDTTKTDYLFYESFDKCDGTGGNDDLWNGTIANTTFIPDNDGWESAKAFGANKCAKFGSSSASGKATTPSFTLDGEATLTFKAACWDSTKDDVTLIIQVDDDDVATFDMARGKWTNYAVDITGTGSTYVTFVAANRFFLDEVYVKAKQNEETDGILNIQTHNDDIMYNLSGMRVDSSYKGIIIKNGKKYLVK